MAKNRRVRLEYEQLENRLALSGGLDLSGVEFRSIDGTGNNVANPTQGAANTPIIRVNYPASYPDNLGNVIDVPGRPNARTISNALQAQTGSVLNDRHLTDWVFQWGQFITHDMDLTISGRQFNALSTGGVGDFRIPVTDPGDPLGPNPIPFNRSEFDPASGFLSILPRQQINRITSYLDASMVYGSDPVRAAALRTFVDGKLKTSANGLLPEFNDEGLPNDDPFHLGAQLFLAGDRRANEQVDLTATHALFVREHNRLATRIHDLYPSLDDEDIYQLARRIVGAEVQIITYQEYLPALLGYDAAPRARDAVYNPDPNFEDAVNFNASITSSFSAAIFRFGHSQVGEQTLLVNNRERTVGKLSIADAFFNPDFLKNKPSNVELVLKGLASQLGQEIDLLVVDVLRNRLFGPPGAGGLDLAALDIQRGRDHGVPNYNSLRTSYGLPRVASFAQITSNPTIQAKLLQLFGSVDNIDAIVGALAEDHLPGASVGALINQIVVNQFTRLRDGDRFFYVHDTLLASPQVRRIINLDNVSLANLIRWNTGITNIQDHVFFDKSVLIFEAPKGGANVSVVVRQGSVTIVDARTRRVLAQKSLRQVSQLMLIGSDSARDVFNLFIAAPHAGMKDGIIVYGRNPANDSLHVFGTPRQDHFMVGAHTTTVNGYVIQSGIKMVRILSLDQSDDIQIADGITNVIVRRTGWPRRRRGVS